MLQTDVIKKLYEKDGCKMTTLIAKVHGMELARKEVENYTPADKHIFRMETEWYVNKKFRDDIVIERIDRK